MCKELRVCTDAINKEADLWEDQSVETVGVSNAAVMLRMSRLQAGIFQVIVSANDDVCDLVSNACLHGSQEMDAVAVALRENSRAYQEQEAEITASVPKGF
ncbi:MAG: hypothetical protein E7Z94_09785 [Actinomyces ruminicola]|nr:hypothetical protein [Actinomyces ruminicola]